MTSKRGHNEAYDQWSSSNPRNSFYHKYNPISRLLFCWLDKLIFKGFKSPLPENDLYTCPSEADSQILLEKFKRYWAVEKEKRSPKMWIAIVKCFYWRFLVHAFVCSLLAVASVFQALLIGYLTEYFTIVDPSSNDTSNAYLLALGVTLLAASLIVLNGMMAFIGLKLSMMVRVLSCSAIYQKIYKLSSNRVSELTVGHIINLASNDVHCFDQSLLFYNFIWIAPLHLAVATYYIYIEIGPSAFIGTALVLLQVPLQHFLGQLFIKLRLSAAKLTDQRIVIMNEIITGIRVIKMYGWEYAFRALVTNVRSKEVHAIFKSSIVHVITLSYIGISLPTMMFAIFSLYVSLDEDNVLTTKKVFTTLSLLVSVRLISLNIFVHGVVQLSEGRVALQRISNFLLVQENDLISSTSSDDLDTNGGSQDVIEMSEFYKKRTCSTNGVGEEHKSDPNKDDVGIILDNISSSWSMSNNNVTTLSDVSFNVNKSNPLLAVIGTVGAGKSTLLKCILDELPLLRGTITVRGRIAYVSQEPWIFTDTLRANVLFGLDYEPSWYNTVIEACALDKDIDQLAEGDMTVVGERGVTLSGGQKARVNLARAVYRNADIYLLDDPLSAVDAAVGRHIFNKCIKGILSNKSCIVLVTHQLQYLQQCDQVLGLKEGCVTIYGQSSDILENDTDILTLIGGERDDHCTLRRFSNDDQMIDKNSLELYNANEAMDTINEESVVTSTMSHDNHVVDDYDEDENNEDTAPLIVKVQPNTEEKGQGTISTRTYYRYFVVGGGYLFTVMVLAMYVFAECCIVATDWWMADWADCNEDTINSTISRCSLADNQRIGVYFGLLSSVWFSTVMRNFLFYILALRAARILHNKMLMSIIRAPVLFFDTNTSGRILNRFSKDMGFLDDILIYTFCEFIQRITRFLAIMITAIVANYYLLVVVLILSVVLLVFREYYIRSARNIKHIEALSRSPLYSHISMTLQGLVTIRSYGMVEQMMNKFYKYQNGQTQAWYLYIVSARWFAMRIDLICSVFIAAVAFISIPLAHSLNPGLVGLALTYAVSLSGMFQYCVRLSTEIESLMVSAERVLAYSEDIDSEASLETDPLGVGKPPNDWPDGGQIDLIDVSYQHSKDTPHVLKQISAIIKPGEKVGIVGRTGAGKSSLVAALFRLAEPFGSIRIDGIDVLSLGLHDLRTTLSIIPQDPVLFTGSIRYNLDPFNCYNDEDIWKALEHVQLKLTVESLESGLESHVSEGGNNFSVGQRQLFCLARALLRNNKILIMDEATANVDLETDAIIQQVIQQRFKTCTVLTIAHRLDTVMDSDRIMVLRFGELIEFDVPHLLLANSGSYLLKLVDHTGSEAAQRLKEMAFMAYKERQSSFL